MPDGILGEAYVALGRGDNGPLLALLGDTFEWVEPELQGYPLAGVHRGPDAVAGVLAQLEKLLDGFALEAHEVAEAGERETVTGVMRGRPAGGEDEWELPFAHVWEVAEDDSYLRVRTYFDRSRLTLAAARRQLAEVADDLLEQAAEIRRQWAQLGDAVRGDGEPAKPARERPADGDDDAEPALAVSASARLAAVDMAHEGATRQEVEAHLRDELHVEDPAPLLDEVFAENAAPVPETLEERAAEVEARRLSRLFARNRG
jgi:ketosteroid isomerase-like protein